jgi:hypothetical protein
MNKHDELTGTFVLVHPHLMNDPEDRKNQVGIIATAELENDNVMVSFGKTGQSLFSADALLVLRKPADIHFDAMKDHLLLETQDFKDLLRLAILADSSLTKNRREAVEMARVNPTLMEYGMASLENELGLQHDQYMSR